MRLSICVSARHSFPSLSLSANHIQDLRSGIRLWERLLFKTRRRPKKEGTIPSARYVPDPRSVCNSHTLSGPVRECNRGTFAITGSFCTDCCAAGPRDPDGSQPRSPGGRRVIPCFRCGDPCRGQVLRVQNSHFHMKCFTCRVCGCDLAHSGFFLKSGDYLCPLDFQRLHGTLCSSCGDFVEGSVVTVLGKTYHPACFVCSVCKEPFPAGDSVTFSGKDCLCQRCVRPATPPCNDLRWSGGCSGCGRDIKNGQALSALGGQWHLGCFKCKACRRMLSGEYISKDGFPYCERDYQIQFGVTCEACQKFITGKVLEAGEKNYHPSCARCSRCDKMFTEGEDMYVQGSTVWHPDCGDGSRAEDAFAVNAAKAPGLHFFSPHHKLQPTTSSSESSFSRPGSCTPGSPGRTICAKVDNEIIDYRELAALPRVKAIFDIEHPDMMSYESVSASSTRDTKGVGPARRGPAESPGKASETTEESFEVKPRTPTSKRPASSGPHGTHDQHNYTPNLSRSPQHFHRPDQGFNMYGRPPIYKQQDPRFATSQTSSLPGYGRGGLDPPQSADRSPDNSDRSRARRSTCFSTNGQRSVDAQFVGAKTLPV